MARGFDKKSNNEVKADSAGNRQNPSVKVISGTDLRTGKGK